MAFIRPTKAFNYAKTLVNRKKRQAARALSAAPPETGGASAAFSPYPLARSSSPRLRPMISFMISLLPA
jgi:hypothetical protein